MKHDRFGEFIIREEYIDFFDRRGLIEQKQYAANEYLTFFMRNYFAVMIIYKSLKKDMIPHIERFKTHLQTINTNPYICRMRRICSKIMLRYPRIAYIIAKQTIPDCLIEEMR